MEMKLRNVLKHSQTVRARFVICAMLVGAWAGQGSVAQENEPAQAAPAADPEWVDLFNGEDLTGWTVKIAGHPVGENYADTFRVEDGILKVTRRAELC